MYKFRLWYLTTYKYCHWGNDIVVGNARYKMYNRRQSRCYKFVFGLSFMLSIDRHNNFLLCYMVGSSNEAQFWYRPLFMPWKYSNLASIVVPSVLPKHKTHIGTSHFTAGYLKVLNPPISLPLEMTLVWV